jgi:hypothetical protein
LSNLFEFASHTAFLHVFPLGYFLCIAISGRDNRIKKELSKTLQ